MGFELSGNRDLLYEIGVSKLSVSPPDEWSLVILIGDIRSMVLPPLVTVDWNSV